MSYFVTTQHRKLIEGLLLRYFLPADTISFENDLADDNGSPFRIAFAGKNPETGDRKIFILKQIPIESMDSIRSAIMHPSVDKLNHPVLFLKHLILHEIRHIQHNHNCLDPEKRSECEKECDHWAFTQLKHLEEETI